MRRVRTLAGLFGVTGGPASTGRFWQSCRSPSSRVGGSSRSAMGPSEFGIGFGSLHTSSGSDGEVTWRWQASQYTFLGGGRGVGTTADPIPWMVHRASGHGAMDIFARHCQQVSVCLTHEVSLASALRQAVSDQEQTFLCACQCKPELASSVLNGFVHGRSSQRRYWRMALYGPRPAYPSGPQKLRAANVSLIPTSIRCRHGRNGAAARSAPHGSTASSEIYSNFSRVEPNHGGVVDHEIARRTR